MTRSERLFFVVISVFILCIIVGAAPVHAQSAAPRACKVSSPYPPAATPCTSPPCIISTTPASLVAATDFQVTFTGIICIAGGAEGDPPSLERHAMMIHGNVFTKRHTPLLGVHGVDPVSLRKASGHSVECDHTYCWTAVHGLRLRIVGDDDKPPIGTAVDEDDSFCDLVPRLRSLVSYAPEMKYDLCADDDSSLPKSPVAGCFDIAGGTLMAYPFKRFQQGRFVFPDGQVSPAVQFADVVIWHGQTIGTARLQIKSPDSGNVWRTVKSKIDHAPLLVAAVNLGHAHHVTTHFVLNEKIYNHLTGNLPTIIADNVPPCDPEKVYCYSGVTSLIDVAGCSNTRP